MGERGRVGESKGMRTIKKGCIIATRRGRAIKVFAALKVCNNNCN